MTHCVCFSLNSILCSFCIESPFSFLPSCCVPSKIIHQETAGSLPRVQNKRTNETTIELCLASVINNLNAAAAAYCHPQAAENVAATLRFDVIWMSISYISTTWKSPRLAQILTSIIVHHVDVKWHGILHVSKTTNIFKIKNADALLLSLRYLLFF